MAIPCVRLLILACSAIGCGGPRYMPAFYRYDGPPGQTLLRGPEEETEQGAFLSAGLGLKMPKTPIKMYQVPVTVGGPITAR